MTVEDLDLVDVGCAEAGAALLGSALFGCPIARAAILELTEGDLSDVRQRAVLVAMHALIARDAPLDPVTVLGEMRANGSAGRLSAGRDCGVYLADLQEAGMSGHARHYLRVILEHGLRRVTLEVATRIAQAARRCPIADLPAFVTGEHARIVSAAQRVETTR